MNKNNVLNYLLAAAQQLLYTSASSGPHSVGTSEQLKSVKEAVKLLAMPLFYKRYKDIITQHIVD